MTRPLGARARERERTNALSPEISRDAKDTDRQAGTFNGLFNADFLFCYVTLAHLLLARRGTSFVTMVAGSVEPPAFFACTAGRWRFLFSSLYTGRVRKSNCPIVFNLVTGLRSTNRFFICNLFCWSVLLTGKRRGKIPFLVQHFFPSHTFRKYLMHVDIGLLIFGALRCILDSAYARLEKHLLQPLVRLITLDL